MRGERNRCCRDDVGGAENRHRVDAARQVEASTPGMLSEKHRAQTS